MGLFKCPECGTLISTNAASCPKCGFDVISYMRAYGDKIRCNQCWTLNEPGTQFCTNCRSSLQNSLPVKAGLPADQVQYIQINQASPNPGRTKLCKHCQSPMPIKAKICPVCHLKQHDPGKWILIVVLVFCIFAIITGNNRPSSSSKDNSSSDTQAVSTPATSNTEVSEITESEVSEVSEISFEEFADSCEDLEYKKIMRSPDDFVGKNFKVTVQIFSSSEKSLFRDAYYKAYLDDDGNGVYFDKMIFLFDEQDENSEEYVHILDDDIVTVYGTFEGTVESTNFLNGEKSQEIALHVKYAELISE